VLYLEKGNFDMALKMDSAVLKIYRDLNNEVETFYVFQNMGSIDEKKGDLEFNHSAKNVFIGFYKRALYNYENALVSSQHGTDSSLLAEAFNNLGGIRIKLKDFEAARSNLMISLSLGKGSKSNLKSVYGSLASLDSIQGNYKQAYEHYKMYILFRDSLVNEESTKRSLQSKMQYEFDKKEAVAKAEQDKKDAEAKRVKNLQYFAIGGLAVVVLAVLLIASVQWRHNTQKKKANAILQQQKEKVESTLSELKATQTQLIQSEKMASLGELTAGIAHEIQNPLNFVNNFSEVNKELIDEASHANEAGNSGEVKELLSNLRDNEEKINHHGKRADAIVKGMLQHSRQTSGTKEPTDINALADEYLRLSYHGLRAKDKSFNATLKPEYDETIGNIPIIPQDIGRVLLNLYNNAFYAVSVKKKQQPEGFEPTISVNTKKLNRKVEIRVKDNGNGIPHNIVDKIFQPFFTTKPTGQGTGLGLSLAYDIVKAHGGELKVETKEGEGAEFIIELPLK
jgi:two-component system, NtrC family, sensor kinase